MSSGFVWPVSWPVANAMNQGGMMYNEIMNRPMFQTPQMREGSGIMAGVAPIRGYAEGDLVTGGITGGRSQAAQDDDEIVDAGTADELASKLFGEGGRCFRISPDGRGHSATHDSSASCRSRSRCWGSRYSRQNHLSIISFVCRLCSFCSFR